MSKTQKKTKYLFIDVEVLPNTKEVRQIQLKPMINGKVLPGINVKIKFSGMFKSVQFREEHNRNALSKEQAFKKIINYLQKYINKFDSKDKFVLVAHNLRFDRDYLHKFFKDVGNRVVVEGKGLEYLGNYCFSHGICTIGLTSYALGLSNQYTELTDFKLSTICNYFKIDVDKDRLHDASYDTQILIRLFRKLNKIIENHYKTKLQCVQNVDNK